MSNQHTAGPWEYGEVPDPNTEPQWPKLVIQQQSTGHNICEITLPDDSDEANARLIAAAPELLEACKAAFKFTQSSHDADVDLDLMLARAIAKAEGITT